MSAYNYDEIGLQTVVDGMHRIRNEEEVKDDGEEITEEMMAIVGGFAKGLKDRGLFISDESREALVETIFPFLELNESGDFIQWVAE